MARLLYYSVSALKPEKEIDDITSILRTSRAWNAEVEVTGALLYTGSHFAQALEGDDERVAELLRLIIADKRHSQLTVVHRDDMSTRRFPSWNMAYRGPSSHVRRSIQELMIANSDEAKPRAIKQVYEVMADIMTP